MEPRRNKDISEHEWGIDEESDATIDRDNNIDRYLQRLQPYTFIEEQGFDPLMRNYKRIWEIATEREWTNFCLPPEEPKIIPIVQEFYVALKEREVTRPFYEL
ncbi:hypothetical protein Goari_002931 [Gossypium aridum]|uniref:Uncharacterized protein n=1 Tax=Gossypium aridum TaxID=34290 RepID=A0A7J8Y9Z5_GOSAI|nr:hypothetical protein [Gossypium aridum]